MAQVGLRKLSGSIDGRGIKVVATASAGTLIHTAVAGVVAGTWDQVEVYAYNSDTVARLLTLQWGGTTSPDDDIKVTIQPQSGLVAVVVDGILQNGAVVRAYAAAANVITIHGCARAVIA